MIKKILLIIILLSLPVNAARLYNEAYYQNQWAKEHGGILEYELEDWTRVDLLTETHAIEFDFAKKWAEAIGQSLHYSRMTNKKPGIVLIIEKPKDFIYYDRIKPLCEKYDITLWYVKGMEYDAQK